MGCSLSNINTDPTCTLRCVCTNVGTDVSSSSVKTGSISVASRAPSCPLPAEPTPAPVQAARVSVPANTGELSLVELHVNTVIQLTPCIWLDIKQFVPLHASYGFTSRRLPRLPLRLVLTHRPGLLHAVPSQPPCTCSYRSGVNNGGEGSQSSVHPAVSRMAVMTFRLRRA